MSDDAEKRKRLQSEERQRAEEQAKGLAEAADAAHQDTEAEDGKHTAETTASPMQYSGFCWGSSFDDPRLMNAAEGAQDAPRVVELDVD